jgi:KUP system potassium uptake protein
LIDQAISLRVFPNVKTIHPSTESGEVYIPVFNYLILVGSITLILTFQDSEKIAGVFGIGVAFTMTCTTIFYILAMRYTWDEPLWKIISFSAVFLTIDLVLLTATCKKLISFGWVTFVMSFTAFLLMYIWYITTGEINDQLKEQLLEMSELRTHVKNISRTQGTVVFVSNTDEDVPNVLRICAQRLRCLPENIVCMSAISSTAPFIADEERTVFRTVDASAGIYRLVISYGKLYQRFTLPVAPSTRPPKTKWDFNWRECNYLATFANSENPSLWYSRLRRTFHRHCSSCGKSP